MASPVKVRPESVVSTPAPEPPATEFVGPADLAGLVVDGFEDAFAPDAVVGAGPAEGAVGGLGEVDAVAGVRVDDEQAGLGVEAGRAVVGQAAFVGRDQAAVGRGLLCRDWEWAGLLVDAQRPVHRAEGRGEQALAVGAVEHEEVAVARGLHQHLARLAVKVAVDQHGRFDGVPVVGVVRRGWKAQASLPVSGLSATMLQV